ncbi:Sialidase A precursor [Halalkalibacter krulwichiae]|uniref:exo-alpha-sialidase n=2 Tax=Halalkalibacter krulwichiae TaxID=199441 RepID=A0A1X9MCI0_9BACI|nr:sialidase family protein [Halalkalibacter krulwichiae]ARK29843.1 Sialidase A precursor [Halalkalibacter krulwichiae]
MKQSKMYGLMIFTFLLLPFLCLQAVTTVGAAEQPSPLLRYENLQLSTGTSKDLSEYVDELSDLDEGTIIVRFRYSGSSFMSLFSLSNNTLPDSHFHLYISPGTIGSENRYQGPDFPKSNIHTRTSSVSLAENYVHTLALVVDKNQGYKYFLNGELVHSDQQSKIAFLDNIHSPNSAKLGKTERSSGNEYLFNGNIDFAEVYSTPLDDQYLLEITGQTHHESLENPLPDDAFITEPSSIFYPGFMDSNNYRIPALYYTMNGTLLAGIDRRVNHGGDSPNDIHAAVRRSFDQGETWETDGIIINAYPDQASNIDLAFTQDETNERIFALVDGFPNGAGLMGGFGNNAYKGTGFKEIDGNSYMFLVDQDENEYTIREEGVVYNQHNEATNYRVDERRDLYLDDEKIDNIFSATTPLTPYKTSYLELYFSDDEGETWTGPIDLNPETKEEWMIFLGVGPGNGIQLKEGTHKGRIVFPVYFLNDHNRQASAVVYSDDNGKTWHRGESPNEGRLLPNGETIREKDFTNHSHEITEAQVVEIPNGQLKMFMRNYSGFAQIATSFDGGETWHEEVVTEEALVAPYSQMSAIRFNGQIDGKEAIIFSSANHPNNRVNGTVRVGLIEEDGTYSNGETNYSIDWRYEQLVKEGHYGYSSLANLESGRIGLFYEATANTNMDYIQFNTEFLKWDRFGDAPKPSIESVQLISQGAISPGQPIQLEVTMDEFVILTGTRSLFGTLAGHQLEFTFVDQLGNQRFLFEATAPQLPPRSYSLTLSVPESLLLYNVYGNKLEDLEPIQSFNKKIAIRK